MIKIDTFFHLSIVIRRRNKIEGLMNKQGIWIQNNSLLKDIAVNHFIQLFSDDMAFPWNTLLPRFFPMLPQYNI